MNKFKALVNKNKFTQFAFFFLLTIVVVVGITAIASALKILK
jgi:hypothetical protein